MILIPLVVATIAPSKQYDYHRLSRLICKARRRYERRQIVAAWFWQWARLKWRSPRARLVAKTTCRNARRVPALASFRPRVTRYTRLDGTEVRIVGANICYEDCVHLYEQAHALLLRLERAAAT